MKSIVAERQTSRGLFAKVNRFVLSTVIAATTHAALAQVAPSLGTAKSFGILAGSTVTNTGPTLITGNLGVSPGTAVTGFPPGTVAGGSIHAADAVAGQAQSDSTTAYGDLASQACNTSYGVPTDLGGMTLVPGVYCFLSSAQLTGTVTLNAGGSASAVWVFKVGSALTTASNSSVLLINGAQACNVFWQIGSSATLGTGTAFIGDILALTSITLSTDATLNGRALAQNGAVTLDSNTVAISSCSVPVNPVPPTIGGVFSPSTIYAGGTSTETLTISNPNGTAASLTAPFTDNMPVGLVIAGNGANTCGGTLSAPAGASKIVLTGGSIPANGSCMISFDVRAPGKGNFIDSVAAGDLKTSNGNNAAPSVATLTVAPVVVTGEAPLLGKSFSPGTIHAGSDSTVTLTLSNPNSTVANLTAPLTDTLPTGVTIAGNPSTTCNGVVTATLGSSMVKLTGGWIPANGSCTVTVLVNAKAAGSYFNSLVAGALQTDSGNNASPALATLSVLPLSNAPTLSKSFSPSTIKVGAVSLLTITLSNPGSKVAHLTAPLTDHLPSGQVVSGWASTTCKGTVTANKGSSTVTLNGGAIPAYGSCTVKVDVTANHNTRCVNTLPAGALKTCSGSNPKSASATLTVNSY